MKGGLKVNQRWMKGGSIQQLQAGYKEAIKQSCQYRVSVRSLKGQDSLSIGWFRVLYFSTFSNCFSPIYRKFTTPTLLNNPATKYFVSI
jgi:hypothetical protein